MKLIVFKKFLCCLILLLIVALLNNSFSQTEKKIPSDKPKLIIIIVVDQMRYDYINRFWNKFENNGFKKIINEGAFCKNANYNFTNTETAVGHATISTGTNPSNHGIVGNSWYLPLKKETIYCVQDNKAQTIGTKSKVGGYSPKLLLTTTLGDAIRLSNNFKSKVFTIAIKERAAILTGGHTANEAYWFDEWSGNFVTSSYYTDTLPKWVNEFNNKKFADLYINRQWTTLLPIEQYTESWGDNCKFEGKLFNKYNTFPYNLTDISKFGTKNFESYKLLKTTPFGNNLVKDFAIATIVNEKLGSDDFTDLLVISFSATDFIGHTFGPSSIEVQDTYLRLDKELAHFLEFIDATIGKENTLLVLTSDHGTAENTQYLNSLKIPAGKFEESKAITLLKSYLKAIYGEGDWVLAYLSKQIYLNRNLIEDSKLSLAEVQNKSAQFLLQFNGIANVITASQLETASYSDNIFKKIQNGFNQKRSGDIIINLAPNWTENTDETSVHGSGYTYDTHVPLIWYGWKINRSTINTQIDIIDIVPTISMMLNIDVPNGCTGKFINDLVK